MEIGEVSVGLQLIDALGRHISLIDGSLILSMDENQQI